MISLYIILLISSFLVGWWDGGDITYFVFLLIFAPLVLDEIKERRKVKKCFLEKRITMK